MRILFQVNAAARSALNVIRECIEADRYVITTHFARRMDQRTIFWPDVLCVIGEPSDVQSDGMDDQNRPKWLISGQTTGALELELVCAIDEHKDRTVFITIYWD